jgi:hypothetical protein
MDRPNLDDYLPGVAASSDRPFRCRLPILDHWRRVMRELFKIRGKGTVWIRSRSWSRNCWDIKFLEMPYLDPFAKYRKTGIT